MEIHKYCRLCAGIDPNDLIEIFNEQGIRLKISSIVGSHFLWFKVNIWKLLMLRAKIIYYFTDFAR